MPSTYTTNNGIELIGTGEQTGTWGSTTNDNLTFIDTSLDGHITVTLATAGTTGSPNTLPITDGATSNGRNRAIIFTDGGDLGANVYVQLTPNDAKKIIFVRNSLSGSRSLVLFQGTYNSSNDFVLAAGKDAIVKFDGAGSGAVVSALLADLALDAATIGTLNATTVNATTVDTTNIEVTTIKAKDGTASATIADSTGVMTVASSVLTTTDINGGTIDGVTLGTNSAVTELQVDNLNLNGNTISSTNTNGNITLDPNGTGVTDVVGVIRSDGADLDGAVVINDAGADVDFRVESDTNPNALFVDGTSGNVGIGVTSPSQRLAVINNTDYQARVATATGNYTSGGIVFGGFGADASDPNFYGAVGYNHSTGKTYIRNKEFNAVGGIVFETATTAGFTERARIDSSGNLLVGLTAATAKVSVNNGNVVQFTGAWENNNAGTQYFHSFAYNGGQIGQITGNNTGTTYATSSDYRLKENVAPMQNALDTVAQLNPVTYTWKADGSAGQGFIAHELQAVVPDCVTGEKDAVDAEGNPQYQGVDTSFLVATLVKAIQELKAEVDSLPRTT